MNRVNVGGNKAEHSLLCMHGVKEAWCGVKVLVDFSRDRVVNLVAHYLRKELLAWARLRIERSIYVLKLFD